MVFDRSKPITLVFLHGWGMNKMVWQPFLSKHDLAIQPEVNYLTIDLPGFGENQAALESHDYTLRSMAKYIEDRIPSNSILVAWSLAGLVSQQLINAQSQKVIGQIQVCSSPKFTEESNWPGIKHIVLKQFAKQLKQDHTALLKRFLAIQCLGLDNAKEVYRWMYDALINHPLSNEASLTLSLALLSDTDLRDSSLHLASSPASLRIFGGLDSLVPRRAIPLIKEIYPKEKYVVFDKASHAPFISHSTQFAETLSSFVLEEFLSEH